ncbi:hypothetical protein ACO34A_23795 (plasmid) [Rhizobium sp. ACO-34A]|nr:hypothetical protein [Rhizobium sp. ACO-34A]ATN36808.1 hypothetical protein ACO34A_23795 [Rhizobium sp. ACO-34A]
MLHYHGTPLTPRPELEKLAGKHFCVSFAAPQDADWCLAHGQSVMWDNGAFSAFTREHEVQWEQYYRWLEPRLGGENWAVIPDVIDGTIEDQRALVGEWPYPKVAGAPVWHMALPTDYLLEIADRWPRICFGSSGRYWQVGSDSWRRRADEAFNTLSRHGHLPWLKVHMLRGLRLAGDRWPFASVDSANVARNFKNIGSETCPERMARRIDAVQSPVTWTERTIQGDLFHAA